MTEITDREAAALARKTLGGFNLPKAERAIPLSHAAMTFVTLPNGKVIKLFGFAHERQVATVTRKHLREAVAVEVAHVVVDRRSGAVTETRATFLDNESAISRREI